MCITNNTSSNFEYFRPAVNFPFPHTFIAMLKCHHPHPAIVYILTTLPLTGTYLFSFFLPLLLSSSPSKQGLSHNNPLHGPA
jgi:hypothetical protein